MSNKPNTPNINPPVEVSPSKKQWITPVIEIISVASGSDPRFTEGYLMGFGLSSLLSHYVS